ncbi:MAG: RNA 2',3'-cyclic phosphodiesterase [Synergistaceae bacterium]|jgi:2'-5' RNA ligase|nr:RNA 2',3'-cyclic phosphodiesterase [Synergistaceae bacterium]
MRTFVAVTPPEDVLDRMEDWLTRLRPLAPYKWVSRAQLHLTLRFLGEASRAQTDVVAEALDKLKFDPFAICLGRVGGFPHLGRPRVLWTGEISGTKDIAALAAKVEETAVGSGFPPETKKFNAHLTLARAPGTAPPPELVKALKTVPSFSWLVSRFSLVRSELTPRGPIYTPLREYPLGRPFA